MSNRMSMRCLLIFVFAVLMAASASGCRADDGPNGWYFSGKGGPTYAALSGVHSTSGGVVNSSGSSNVIGAFGMAAGYSFVPNEGIPLRAELEFMNRTEVTYDSSPLLLSGGSGALASTVQNVSTMAKFYWHFPVGSDNWWPFVSSGIGWSHNTAKSQYTPTGGSSARYTTTTDDLAWSVGGGASFKLGPQIMNDVELRWVDLGRVNWGLPASANIENKGLNRFSAVEVSFSIRYMF